MRIRRFTASNYGQFDDLTLSLGPGCTVIYGPNEAGKSTLLYALGDFLWGITAQRHPYAFEYAAKKMLLSARLESRDGDHEVVRRINLLSDSDGTAIEPYWSEGDTFSRDAWNAGFGMDLDGLQRGGRDVLEGEGDLADLIFLAETGALIHHAREQLRRQMEELYKPHKGARNVEIRVEVKRAVQIRESIDERVVDAPEVEAARDEVDRLQRRLDTARSEVTGWGQRHRRAEELQRCLPTAQGITQARGELQEALAGFDPLSRRDCDTLDGALQTIEAKQRSIRRDSDASAKTRRRLEELDVNHDLLRHSETLAGMQQSVGTARSAKSKLDNPAALDASRAAVIRVLEALGVTGPEDLAAEVAGLILKEEDRAQLDALARDVEKAGEREEQLVAQVELLQGKLRQFMARAQSQQAEGTALAESRGKRDEAWTAIRDPWVSGQLPEPSVRRAAADLLDRRIATTDELAESRAAELQQVAHRRGEQEGIRNQLSDLEARVEEARKDVQAAREAWSNFAQQCGLTAGLQPEYWPIRAKNLDALDSVWHTLVEQSRALERARMELAEFATSVDALRQLLGAPPEDSFACAAQLAKSLEVSQKAAGEETQLEERIQELEGEIADAEVDLRSARSEVAGIASTDDAAGWLERSRSVHGLEDTLRILQDTLDGQKEAGSETDALLVDLSSQTPEGLQSAVSEAAAGLAEQREQLERAIQEHADAVTTLRGLEEGQSVAELRQEQTESGERIQSLAEQYQLLAVQAHLLDQLAKDLAASQDSPLLGRAGDYLSILTGGRYVGLRKHSAGPSQSLEVVRHDPDTPGVEGVLGLESLSEGTADQLFLALRLAGIEARQSERREKGRVTLPVVLDDILMAFDDTRARAALGLLGELGRDFQILLLTHHRHVLDLARNSPGVTAVEMGQATATNLE